MRPESQKVLRSHQWSPCITISKTKTFTIVLLKLVITATSFETTKLLGYSRFTTRVVYPQVAHCNEQAVDNSNQVGKLGSHCILQLELVWAASRPVLTARNVPSQNNSFCRCLDPHKLMSPSQLPLTSLASFTYCFDRYASLIQLTIPALHLMLESTDILSSVT